MDLPEPAREVYPPVEWVADASVEDAEASGYAKVESEDHILGGYWFPVSEEPEDSDAFVDSREQIAGGELIQFPQDERPPELADGSDAPMSINDRHVDATFGGGGNSDS